MITLDAITLPEDLHWEDETDWTPVEQSQEYSLAGSLVLDAGVKQAGRPITLVGGDDRAWTNRATVLALMAKAATPGAEMTLTLNDARTYTVMFRHGDGKPVDARPVVAFTGLSDADYYTLTLRLMEV